MTSIIPSYLQPFTEAFYGLGVSTQADIKQGDKLYIDFLQQSGLTANSVSNASPTQQAMYQAQYSAFLEQKLAGIYQTQSIVALSPDEMKLRNIMFETFAIVLKMLNTLQNTQRELSAALVVNAKEQDQYTKLMTSVPLYTADASSNIVGNLADFGKTTLGYANITVEDVVKTLMFGPASSASTDSAIDLAYAGQSGSVDFLTPTLKFTLYYQPTGVEVDVYRTTDPVSGPSLNLYGSGMIPLPSLKQSANTLVGPVLSGLTYQFQNRTGPIPWLSGPTFEDARNQILQGSMAGTPWPTSTVTDTSASAADINKNRLSSRAEINGRLQLDIENARSLRQQVIDRQQPIQDLISQTREATTNQANLLKAITDSIKGLISSIFR